MYVHPLYTASDPAFPEKDVQEDLQTPRIEMVSGCIYAGNAWFGGRTSQSPASRLLHGARLKKESVPNSRVHWEVVLCSECIRHQEPINETGAFLSPLARNKPGKLDSARRKPCETATLIVRRQCGPLVPTPTEPRSDPPW